jgi:hypothetical protein
VFEQRAIAMLGDDGNASLSEIFAQAGVPIGIRDGLHATEKRARRASGHHPFDVDS